MSSGENPAPAVCERVWVNKPKSPEEDQARTRRAGEGLQGVTQEQGMQKDRHCRQRAYTNEPDLPPGVRAVARSPTAAPLSPVETQPPVPNCTICGVVLIVALPPEAVIDALLIHTPAVANSPHNTRPARPRPTWPVSRFCGWRLCPKAPPPQPKHTPPAR